MKVIVCVVVLCLSFIFEASCSERGDSLVVVFWNVENFFDYFDGGTGDSDREFSSMGARHWTKKKFYAKCDAMAKTVFWLTDRYGRMPDVIGLAEVENRGVLTKLLNHTLLRKYDYAIVHRESGDRRGIDVGFLYNPDMFKPVGQPKGFELKAHYADGGVVRSRLELWVSGYMLDDNRKIVMDKIHISVNHWPSRYGGEESSRATRDTAAMLCKQVCDSIYMKEPRAKIIVMGDLNDDPYNHSCAVVMGAKKTRKEVEEQGFFNTMWQKLDRGVGSLAYQGSWNLFDQIFISEPLMNAKLEDGKWVYWKSQIFNKPFLTVQEGKDKGTPLRTVKSNVWQDGYADHYPTMIYLIKEK